MVRAIASSFRGGYRSHGKQFVKDLPIRQIDFTDATERAMHDNIVDLVKALIQATERAATATIPVQRQQAEQHARHLRQTVERKVSDLYHITAADLVAVGAILEGE